MDFIAFYTELRTWLIAHPEAILALIFSMAMLEAVAVIGAIVPGVALLFVLSVLAAHAHIDFTLLLDQFMACASQLVDALEPLQIESVDEYDQHLYDALWLALCRRHGG